MRVLLGKGLATSRRVAMPALPAGEHYLGWLPVLSLVSALGLLAVAVAYTGARLNDPWAELVYWVGVLALYLPIATRLVSASASRAERLGLVALLGVGLYGVKVLHSPLAFTFHDELAHWRTARDILLTGRLYGENAIVTTSPLYPGLEIAASALVGLGGFELFDAGVLVVGVARLVFMLALYLFYEEIGRSEWLAGVAVLLYTTNPSFLVFDAQFAYESLALPIAALILFALARRTGARPAVRVGLTVLVLLGLAAVVITHHLTVYALIGLLGLWTLAAWYSRQAGDRTEEVGWTVVLAAVVVGAWLAYVATLTVSYLAGPLRLTLEDLRRLLAGEPLVRYLFGEVGGQMAAPWERLTIYAATALVLITLPFGLVYVWRRYGTNTLALVLAATALAYPATLALRLVPGGAEASSRASAFVFLGVAFVLAIAAQEAWLAGEPGWRRLVIFTTWATVIFLGGAALGTGPWARLPGPYLVAADTRSIEAEGVATAEWATAVLGPGHRFGADRINRLLLHAYGEQWVVTGLHDQVHVSEVFFAPAIGPHERDVLRRAGVRYLLVDRRLSEGLPVVGVYFEQGEPGTFRHTTPISPAALAKFDALPAVSRVYDSGNIQVYDVEALVDER